MVASPDLKSGFHTDSNPGLTNNCDPDLIQISDIKSGLKLDFGFQIWIPDFKPDSKKNPD